MDNLSMDVSRATRAGMSYGFWKAMNPYTKDESVPEPQGYEHICAYCGKTFSRPDKRKIRYCGDRCKQAAERKRKREAIG